MKSIYLLTLAGSLILSGCSVKKSFEPETIESSIYYKNRLDSKIIESSNSGMTLENSLILTKTNGIQNNRLKDGYVLIGQDDNLFIGSDDSGNLSIVNENAIEIFSGNFSSKVLVASVSGNYLAVLTLKNQIEVVDLKTKVSLFRQSEKEILTSTSDIAPPLFLNNMVVFATLGGKVVFLDLKKMGVKTDYIFTGDSYFNNILFMKNYKNSVLLSTISKIYLVTETSILSYEAGIRFFDIDGDLIYVITDDGRVVVLDENLKEITSKKYNFARFVAISFDKTNIYLVEQKGFALKISKDLKTEKIYQLLDNIEDYLFLDKNKIYYGKKVAFIPKD